MNLKSALILTFAAVSVLPSVRATMSNAPLGIEYEEKTAFSYPEANYVGDYQRAQASLVQLKKEGDLNLTKESNIESAKKSIAQAEADLAFERRRLAAALDARTGIGFPECAQIPWGASQKSVKELLSQRGAKLLRNGTPKKITFRSGLFTGDEVHLWDCRFVNDQLYAVYVYFSREQEALELFRSWNEKIATKYKVADIGQDLSYNGFSVRSGFSFRNGYRIAIEVAAQASALDALQTKQWRPGMRWTFPKNDRIELLLADQNSIALVYTNGEIEKTVEQLQEKAHDEGKKDL